MGTILFTAARQDDCAIVVRLNENNQKESIVVPIVAWQMLFNGAEGYKARPVFPAYLSAKFSRIGISTQHGIITDTHVYSDRAAFEADAIASLRLDE